MLGLSQKDGTRLMDDKQKQKAAVRIAGLMHTNERMLNTIESAGVRANLLPSRIRHLTTFLVEQGIMTEEQQINEAEAWELFLREELQPAHEQVKNAMRAQGIPQQTDSGLIVPGVNAPRNMRG